MKLMERIEQRMRYERYSPRTIKSYSHWIVRYITFHELRHPEELAFRNMGYDILLSTFADSGAVTEVAASAGIMLVNAAYSREAESAADALAFQLLKEANISSTGMASFFARIEKKEGTSPRFLKYFNSHPATGKRREAATAHASEGYAALSVKSWQALKAICD